MASANRRTMGLMMLSILTASLTSCTSDDDRAHETTVHVVRVFATISLVDAFEEMADSFESAHPELRVELNFGTAQELLVQIADGSAAGVLVAADREGMAAAVADGTAEQSTPFARNRLAIAVPPGNPRDIHTVADLGNGDERVALCDPSISCGEVAGLLLDAAGVERSGTDSGRSGRSVLARVAAGGADAGIAWVTDFDQFEGVEMVPIEGPGAEANLQIAVLTAAPTRGDAAAFVAFVLTPEGRSILSNHLFMEP